MLKPFSDYVLNEWAVLSGALSTFVIGALFLAGLAYAAARWRYTATIEGLKERLQLRDDRIADYERKLEG
ncbi:MAG: hypothetical protein ACJ8DT_03835, partial [Microvirga sp.]